MVWKKSGGTPPAPPLPGEAALAESLTPPPPARGRGRVIQLAPSLPAAEAAPAPGLILGPSIAFKGELSSAEDLTLAGACSGRVSCPEHRLTVAAGARIEADLEARVIVIEGEVRGSLRAGEQAIVRATGAVFGDITAPRVALDDGARAEGKITLGKPAG